MIVGMAFCAFNFDTIKAQVDQIWEDALLIQFHDARPGSSIGEANSDIIQRGRS
jgi:alpha-mannosidase